MAGPAHGRKPEQAARLLQVLAQLLVEIISPPLTTAASVPWKEVNPPWDVKLTAFVKGTWPSPGSSGFWSV